jgi:hypothetical protein
LVFTLTVKYFIFALLYINFRKIEKVEVCHSCMSGRLLLTFLQEEERSDFKGASAWQKKNLVSCDIVIFRLAMFAEHEWRVKKKTGRE